MISTKKIIIFVREYVRFNGATCLDETGQYLCIMFFWVFWNQLRGQAL